MIYRSQVKKPHAPYFNNKAKFVEADFYTTGGWSHDRSTVIRAPPTPFSACPQPGLTGWRALIQILNTSFVTWSTMLWALSWLFIWVALPHYRYLLAGDTYSIKYHTECLLAVELETDSEYRMMRSNSSYCFSSASTIAEWCTQL